VRCSSEDKELYDLFYSIITQPVCFPVDEEGTSCSDYDGDRENTDAVGSVVLQQKLKKT
jgi:hypothetical protein